MRAHALRPKNNVSRIYFLAENCSQEALSRGIEPGIQQYARCCNTHLVLEGLGRRVTYSNLHIMNVAQGITPALVGVVGASRAAAEAASSTAEVTPEPSMAEDQQRQRMG